jgi:hypothetical protein
MMKPPFTQFIGFFPHNINIETRNRLVNDLTRRETQTELGTHLSGQLHMHYIHEKITNP